MGLHCRVYRKNELQTSEKVTLEDKRHQEQSISNCGPPSLTAEPSWVLMGVNGRLCAHLPPTISECCNWGCGLWHYNKHYWTGITAPGLDDLQGWRKGNNVEGSREISLSTSRISASPSLLQPPFYFTLNKASICFLSVIADSSFTQTRSAHLLWIAPH